MPESGGWVESVEQLEKYMEIHPESDRYVDLAEQLVLAGRPEEALRWCERGLLSHPHPVAGYVVLGKVLFALSGSSIGIPMQMAAARFERFCLTENVFSE